MPALSRTVWTTTGMALWSKDLHYDWSQTALGGLYFVLMLIALYCMLRQQRSKLSWQKMFHVIIFVGSMSTHPKHFWSSIPPDKTNLNSQSIHQFEQSFSWFSLGLAKDLSGCQIKWILYWTARLHFSSFRPTCSWYSFGKLARSLISPTNQPLGQS